MPPTPDTRIEIEYMTWTDVRDYLARGYDTVVFGVGATEQHGPHLPIGTDALLGWASAVGVARALGNALVAPTIRPGRSDHHMDFPGTITLRHATLVDVIVDYCTSLARHGFRNIVVLSAHGGNHDTVRVACQEARRVVTKGVRIIPICDLPSYSRAPGVIPDPHAEGYHANKMETSQILHIAPDLVHMERARDWANPIDPQVRDISALLGQAPVSQFSEDGTMGKPTLASAEIGRDAFERRFRNVAEQIRMILKQLDMEAAHEG